MAEQKVKPAAKKVAITASKTSEKTVTSKVTAAPKAVTEKAEKKPAVKKPAVPTAKAQEPVAPTAKAQAPVAPTAKAQATVAPAVKKARPTPEERYRMVQTAAYFIAERNGFGGNSSDYWVAAELEIADRLR